MSYILEAQRDDDCAAAFDRYCRYVEESKDLFPPGAYELASSAWYFNFTDHRCPHDGWLENVQIIESGNGERGEIRTTEIRLRLRGAYHDGYIELCYPGTVRYMISNTCYKTEPRDWRYDEFRVSPKGHVIHEIEWVGPKGTPNWIIEATDVRYRWLAEGGRE